MKPRNHKLSFYILADAVFLFLLVLSLVGYDQAVRPWMPEHGSRATVETIFWADR